MPSNTGDFQPPLELLRSALSERYSVEREVGRGGMAIVYLAHDRKLDRRVAVKVMRPEIGAALGAERFLREVEIEAALQHPNILPLHDSGSAHGMPYYVMPFVEGESLRARLNREGQLPLPDALRIILDVIAGLGHAHSHGVVHRDVKPENILLSGGRAVLADFGVARALAAVSEHLTETGLAVGTPAYMSPEQAGGDNRLDGRSDLYAVGCVLYEMLAGEPPFDGPTASAVIAKHFGQPPPHVRVVRPQVPEAVDEVIQRMLAKAAADRYATAADLAAAVERAGLVDARDRAHAARRAHDPWRRTVVRRMVPALFVIGIALLAWRGLLRPAAERDRSPQGVGVLYLRDLSVDGALSHVAERLTEGVIDRLSEPGNLRVVPATTVRRFRTAVAPLEALAQEYRVGTLVEGTVDSGDGRLVTVLRLFDGVSLKRIDSYTLEWPTDELNDISQLTIELGDFVRQRIGRRVRLAQALSGTDNEDARAQVQRAFGLRDDALGVLDLGEPAAAARKLGEVDSLLAVAQTLDSHWTLPAIERAETAWHRARALERMQFLASQRSENIDAQSTEPLRRGLDLIAPVLAADSLAVDALEIRGILRAQYGLTGPPDSAERWLRLAERDLSQVVAIDSSRSRAWHRLSVLYQVRGRVAEAAVAASRALRADAFLEQAPLVLQTLIFGSMEVGWADSAAYWCRIARRRFPTDARLLECRLNVLGWFGSTAADVSEAWQALGEIESRGRDPALGERWGFRRFMVAAVLARAGMRDSAAAVVARVRRAGRPPGAEVYDYYEAFVRTILGDFDGALALLASVVEHRPSHAASIGRSYWFRPLWNDPRFVRLTTGSAEEQ